MSENEIPERIRNFIFLHVDSIELLEVLLIFFADEKRSWTAQSLAKEMRSNATSIAQRIFLLKALGLLRENLDSKMEFGYCPISPELHEIVTDLESVYRIRRHKLFELIFSPLKKARDFADAFRKGGKDGREDGREDG